MEYGKTKVNNNSNVGNTREWEQSTSAADGAVDVGDTNDRHDLMDT